MELVGAGMGWLIPDSLECMLALPKPLDAEHPDGRAPAPRPRINATWLKNRKAKSIAKRMQASNPMASVLVDPAAQRQGCVLGDSTHVRWPKGLISCARVVSNGGQMCVDVIQKVADAAHGLVCSLPCGGSMLAQVDSALPNATVAEVVVDCTSVHATKLGFEAALDMMSDSDLIGCVMDSEVDWSDVGSEVNKPPGSPRPAAPASLMTGTPVEPQVTLLTGVAVPCPPSHQTSSLTTTPSPTHGHAMQETVSSGTSSPAQPQRSEEQSGVALAPSVASNALSTAHAPSHEQQGGDNLSPSVASNALSAAHAPSHGQQGGDGLAPSVASNALSAADAPSHEQQGGDGLAPSVANNALSAADAPSHEQQGGDDLAPSVASNALSAADAPSHEQQGGDDLAPSVASNALSAAHAPSHEQQGGDAAVHTSVPSSGMPSQAPQVPSDNGIAIEQVQLGITALKDVMDQLTGTTAAAVQVAEKVAKKKVPEKHLNSNRADYSIVTLQLLQKITTMVKDLRVAKEDQADQIGLVVAKLEAANKQQADKQQADMAKVQTFIADLLGQVSDAKQEGERRLGAAVSGLKMLQLQLSMDLQASKFANKVFEVMWRFDTDPESSKELLQLLQDLSSGVVQQHTKLERAQDEANTLWESLPFIKWCSLLETARVIDTVHSVEDGRGREIKVRSQDGDTAELFINSSTADRKYVVVEGKPEEVRCPEVTGDIVWYSQQKAADAATEGKAQTQQPAAGTPGSVQEQPAATGSKGNAGQQVTPVTEGVDLAQALLLLQAPESAQEDCTRTAACLEPQLQQVAAGLAEEQPQLSAVPDTCMLGADITVLLAAIQSCKQQQPAGGLVEEQPQLGVVPDMSELMQDAAALLAALESGQQQQQAPAGYGADEKDEEQAMSADDIMQLMQQGKGSAGKQPAQKQQAGTQAQDTAGEMTAAAKPQVGASKQQPAAKPQPRVASRQAAAAAQHVARARKQAGSRNGRQLKDVTDITRRGSQPDQRLTVSKPPEASVPPRGEMLQSSKLRARDGDTRLTCDKQSSKVLACGSGKQAPRNSHGLHACKDVSGSKQDVGSGHEVHMALVVPRTHVRSSTHRRGTVQMPLLEYAISEQGLASAAAGTLQPGAEQQHEQPLSAASLDVHCVDAQKQQQASTFTHQGMSVDVLHSMYGTDAQACEDVSISEAMELLRLLQAAGGAQGECICSATAFPEVEHQQPAWGLFEGQPQLGVVPDLPVPALDATTLFAAVQQLQQQPAGFGSGFEKATSAAGMIQQQQQAAAGCGCDGEEQAMSAAAITQLMQQAAMTLGTGTAAGLMATLNLPTAASQVLAGDAVDTLLASLQQIEQQQVEQLQGSPTATSLLTGLQAEQQQGNAIGATFPTGLSSEQLEGGTLDPACIAALLQQQASIFDAGALATEQALGDAADPSCLSAFLQQKQQGSVADATFLAGLNTEQPQGDDLDAAVISAYLQQQGGLQQQGTAVPYDMQQQQEGEGEGALVLDPDWFAAVSAAQGQAAADMPDLASLLAAIQAVPAMDAN